MLRTGRVTLTEEPQFVSATNDDSTLGRTVTVVAQTEGTVVICEDAYSYSTGARVPVIPGTTFNFDGLTGNERVFLASPDDVEVDLIETGVV